MTIESASFSTTYTCPGCGKMTPVRVFNGIKNFEFKPLDSELNDPGCTVIQCTHAGHVFGFIRSQHDQCMSILIWAENTVCYDLLVRILRNPALFIEKDDDDESAPH